MAARPKSLKMFFTSAWIIKLCVLLMFKADHQTVAHSTSTLGQLGDEPNTAPKSPEPNLPDLASLITISPHKRLIETSEPLFTTCTVKKDTTTQTVANGSGPSCKACGTKFTKKDLAELGRKGFMQEVTSNDQQFFYYTGVPNLSTFYFIYFWLLPFLSKLKVYNGKAKALTWLDEFIRRGYDLNCLYHLFGVSQSHVSRVFIAWVRFLNHCFSDLIVWPTRAVNESNMPLSFKEFPKTRAIIDCTEYHVQKPLRPRAQKITYSSYKHANTFKQLIAIMPTGAITFFPKLYGGNLSDQAIIKASGFLNNIEPGDDIMADRGFNIRHLLLNKQATLNIPAFSHGKSLSLKAVSRSRKVASVRIHVERAIRRMKTFKIISGIIPSKLRFYLDSITHIIAVLSNLQNDLAE